MDAEPISSLIGPRERKPREAPEREKVAAADEKPAAAKADAPATAERPQTAVGEGAQAQRAEGRSDAAQANQADAAPADDDEDGDLEPGESGLKKALKAERRLRREARKQVQELQRQIDYITGQMAAQRQAGPAADAPKQQVKDDSASRDLDDFLSSGPAYVRRVAEAKAREPYVKFMQTQITREQRVFEREHADAAPAISLFKQQAERDPQLSARFAAIADGNDAEFVSPVEFAYQWGKAYQQASELGDLGTYRDRVRAELMAELGNQGAGVADAAPAQAPKTLAGARGSGGAGTGAQTSGPVPLEDLIGPRRAARR